LNERKKLSGFFRSSASCHLPKRFSNCSHDVTRLPASIASRTVAGVPFSSFGLSACCPVTVAGSSNLNTSSCGSTDR
jgi:hypothetical protein